MIRYLEVDRHTLEYEPQSQLMRWLWHCYMRFKEQNPPSTILGDNIIIMYASDFHELRTKAEAYERNFKK